MRTQVLLQFENNDCLVAWIDANLRPKVGMYFTGKDGRKGKIIHVYNTVHLEDINRGWHNNI